MSELKLVSWNVNGIRAVEKKGFLDWFEKESPDILCLQETKAHPEQLPGKLIDVPGYFSFWNNPPRKGYAGVCVYSKKKPDEVSMKLGFSDIDEEGRALFLRFKDTVVVNVYFPNGGSGEERLRYKLDFYENFLVFAEKLKDRKVVVCGDFNTAHKEIDLARPRQNENVSGFLPQEREWIDRFISKGYSDTFRQFNDGAENYSWWDYKTRARERNVGWRIDYFFVNNKMLPRLKDAFIMDDVPGSDHCPVGIRISS